MSFRAVSWPRRQLYQAAYGQFHVYRLHIAFRSGAKSRRSTADDLALAGFALVGSSAFESQAVISGQLPFCIGIGGESLPPPASLSFLIRHSKES